MKNIIAFAVCIFILGTTAVMGQTYYYKGVYSVKKQTGMKSESGGGARIDVYERANPEDVDVPDQLY